MIYVSWIHRILRGHWFTPHIVSYDRWGWQQWDGCEVCMINDPATYMMDRHNNGICPKQLMGYYRECKGRERDGVPYGECGRD